MDNTRSLTETLKSFKEETIYTYQINLTEGYHLDIVVKHCHTDSKGQAWRVEVNNTNWEKRNMVKTIFRENFLANKDEAIESAVQYMEGVLDKKNNS